MVSIRESYYTMNDPFGGPLPAPALKILGWATASVWLLSSAWITVRLARWQPQKIRRGYSKIEGGNIP